MAYIDIIPSDGVAHARMSDQIRENDYECPEPPPKYETLYPTPKPPEYQYQTLMVPHLSPVPTYNHTANIQSSLNPNAGIKRISCIVGSISAITVIALLTGLLAWKFLDEEKEYITQTPRRQTTKFHSPTPNPTFITPPRTTDGPKWTYPPYTPYTTRSFKLPTTIDLSTNNPTAAGSTTYRPIQTKNGLFSQYLFSTRWLEYTISQDYDIKCTLVSGDHRGAVTIPRSVSGTHTSCVPCYYSYYEVHILHVDRAKKWYEDTVTPNKIDVSVHQNPDNTRGLEVKLILSSKDTVHWNILSFYGVPVTETILLSSSEDSTVSNNGRLISVERGSFIPVDDGPNDIIRYATSKFQLVTSYNSIETAFSWDLYSGTCSPITRDCNWEKGNDIQRCSPCMTSTHGTEVHAIQIYEPAGSWRGFQQTPAPSRVKSVEIRITATKSAAIVLVLQSYEATKWKITTTGMYANIVDIKLFSYYGDHPSVYINGRLTDNVNSERYLGGENSAKFLKYIETEYSILTSFQYKYSASIFDVSVGVCDN